MLQRLERQILKGIKEGDPESFTSLVDEYYQSVYALLVYLCRNKSTAEDLTQDTFTCAWTNIADYKGHASLKTWLHRIAYNKFFDCERKTKQSMKMTSCLMDGSASSCIDTDPLREITSNESSRILFYAMQELEPDEYAVIVLHYIQDFSYREMADVLKAPLGTIKWRTSLAITKLREILTGRI